MAQKQPESIKITHFINPHMFWFKYEANIFSREFFDLEDKMQKLYSAEKFKPKYNPNIGDKVAVHSKNMNRWVRGSVDHIVHFHSSESRYIIWTLDHGLVIESTEASIRKLPEELAKIDTGLVHFAGISKVVPATMKYCFKTDRAYLEECGSWSQVAVENIEELIRISAEVRFESEIETKEGQLFGNLYVVNHENTTKNIANILKKTSNGLIIDEKSEFLKHLAHIGTNCIPRYLANNRNLVVLQHGRNCIPKYSHLEANRKQESETDKAARLHVEKKIMNWHQMNETLKNLPEDESRTDSNENVHRNENEIVNSSNIDSVSDISNAYIKTVQTLIQGKKGQVDLISNNNDIKELKNFRMEGPNNSKQIVGKETTNSDVSAKSVTSMGKLERLRKVHQKHGQNVSTGLKENQSEGEMKTNTKSDFQKSESHNKPKQIQKCTVKDNPELDVKDKPEVFPFDNESAIVSSTCTTITDREKIKRLRRIKDMLQKQEKINVISKETDTDNNIENPQVNFTKSRRILQNLGKRQTRQTTPQKLEENFVDGIASKEETHSNNNVRNTGNRNNNRMEIHGKRSPMANENNKNVSANEDALTSPQRDFNRKVRSPKRALGAIPKTLLANEEEAIIDNFAEMVIKKQVNQPCESQANDTVEDIAKKTNINYETSLSKATAFKINRWKSLQANKFEKQRGENTKTTSLNTDGCDGKSGRDVPQSLSSSKTSSLKDDGEHLNDDKKAVDVSTENRSEGRVASKLDRLRKVKIRHIKNSLNDDNSFDSPREPMTFEQVVENGSDVELPDLGGMLRQVSWEHRLNHLTESDFENSDEKAAKDCKPEEKKEFDEVPEDVNVSCATNDSGSLNESSVSPNLEKLKKLRAKQSKRQMNSDSLSVNSSLSKTNNSSNETPEKKPSEEGIQTVQMNANSENKSDKSSIDKLEKYKMMKERQTKKRSTVTPLNNSTDNFDNKNSLTEEVEKSKVGNNDKVASTSTENSKKEINDLIDEVSEKVNGLSIFNDKESITELHSSTSLNNSFNKYLNTKPDSKSSLKSDTQSCDGVDGGTKVQALLNRLSEKAKTSPPSRENTSPGNERKITIPGGFDMKNLQNTKTENRQVRKRKSNCLNTSNEKCLDTNIKKNLVLVHGKHSIKPLDKLINANFCEDVHRELEYMRFTEIYRIQAYTWPNLMRGNSLVVVNGARTGKTMSYLPAVCSLIKMRIENEIPDGVGPIGVIIAPNAVEVEQITKLARRFFSNSVNSMAVIESFGIRSEVKAEMRLLNGCALLVATPGSICRLFSKDAKYFDTKRIAHVIFDNIEKMYDNFKPEILRILKKLYNRSSTNEEVTAQLIVTSRIWKPFLSAFFQMYSNTQLVIGSYIDAAVYGRSIFYTKFVEEKTKVTEVLCFINEHPYQIEKLVIVCNGDEEVNIITEALKSKSYYVIPCSGESDATDIMLAKHWHKEQSHEKSILVCTDAVLPELECKNVQNIINYSLPSSWSKFNFRFSTLLEYHENLVISQVMKNSPAKILTLLDENNNSQLPRLIQFFKEHGFIQIKPQIMQLYHKILIAREEQRISLQRTFCPAIAEFGKCSTADSCAYRHVLTKYDAFGPETPRTGIIKVKILHAVSPTRYLVRLLEHRKQVDMKWVKIRDSSNYLKFNLEFGQYFSNVKNHQIHWPITEGDMCVLSDSNTFNRCLVVGVDRKNKNASDMMLHVKLIDVGKTIQCKSSQILVLPPNFAAFPAQAVTMYMTGIVPHDYEQQWDTETVTKVRKLVMQAEESKNVHVEAKISFALKDQIWVNNIILIETLKSISTNAPVLNIKKYLMDNKYALLSKSHTDILEEMATQCGLIGSESEEVDEKNESMILDTEAEIHAEASFMNSVDRIRNAEADNKESELNTSASEEEKNIKANENQKTNEEKWEEFEMEEFFRISIGAFYTPNSLYIQKLDNLQRMEQLYDAIDKYVETNSHRVLLKPELGVNCLAKIDGKFNRAKVTSVVCEAYPDDIKVHLFFCDIGMNQVQNLNEILKSEDYLVHFMPFQAIRCKLIGIEPLTNGFWVENVCDRIYDDILDIHQFIYARSFQKESCIGTSPLTLPRYGVLLVDNTDGKVTNLNEAIVKENLGMFDLETRHFLDVMFTCRQTYAESDDELEFETWDNINVIKSPLDNLTATPVLFDHFSDFDIQMTDEDVLDVVKKFDLPFKPYLAPKIEEIPSKPKASLTELTETEEEEIVKDQKAQIDEITEEEVKQDYKETKDEKLEIDKQSGTEETDETREDEFEEVDKETEGKNEMIEKQAVQQEDETQEAVDTLEEDVPKETEGKDEELEKQAVQEQQDELQESVNEAQEEVGKEVEPNEKVVERQTVQERDVKEQGIEKEEVKNQEVEKQDDNEQEIKQLKVKDQDVDEGKVEEKVEEKPGEPQMSSNRNSMKHELVYKQKPPKTVWRQEKGIIKLYIEAPDVVDYYLSVDLDHLIFHAMVHGEPRLLALNLFGAVVPSSIEHKIVGLNVVVTLEQALPKFPWPRLCNEPDKHSWLKYDLNSLAKEESEAGDAEMFPTQDDCISAKASSSSEETDEDVDDCYQNVDRLYDPLADDFS